MDAVRAHDEVVLAGRAVGELDATVLPDAVDGHAEPDVRSGRLHRLLEERVELRPGQPVHRGIARAEQVEGRHLAEQIALAVVEPRSLHRVPLRDRLLGQPESVQGPDRVPRLDDPDAVDVPAGVDLDDVDVDLSLTQRDRGREAADATPDDEDAHYVNSPVAAFASSVSGGAKSTGGKDSNIECGSEPFL